MQYLVTGKEMKLLDQNTSNAFKVPELVLMEQAAMAFVQKLLLLIKENNQTINHVVIACGSGNNGADGLAIARLLMQQGYVVSVVLVGEAAGGTCLESYRIQKEICEAYGIKCDTKFPNEDADLLIDAVFGIGLTRPVTMVYADYLRAMKQLDCRKVAVDIASGISSDTGEVMGEAVAVEDTITFSFGKRGQFLWPGNEYSGKVHIVPIGITLQSMLGETPAMRVIEKEDLFLLPKRNAHSNKGTYGKLLVIAGSKDMAGAACLCAKAAYRMGCGIVKVFTARENRDILLSYLPEAIISTYETNEEALEERVKAELNWADAVVAGPGIGTGETAFSILKTVWAEANMPCVLDADALNLLANNSESFDALDFAERDWILTPHLGELSRLTQSAVSEIQRNICQVGTEFAANHKVTVVCKDFHTITACKNGAMYCNLLGNPGMATAGSGDVLAGIIGAFLAQKNTTEIAASYGVAFHGYLGDKAKETVGERALMAEDLLNGLLFKE